MCACGSPEGSSAFCPEIAERLANAESLYSSLYLVFSPRPCFIHLSTDGTYVLVIFTPLSSATPQPSSLRFRPPWDLARPVQGWNQHVPLDLSSVDCSSLCSKVTFSACPCWHYLGHFTPKVPPLTALPQRVLEKVAHILII